MWTVSFSEDFVRRRKRYEKKSRREIEAVLDNFARLFKSLDEGAKLRQIKFGFLHPEPHGVIAVDQKGGGSNLAETRLYVFPDEVEMVLYVLTLGDKRSQSEDIKTCSDFVADYRRKSHDDGD